MSFIQTDRITAGATLLANFRNSIDGGDMTINPFQRGTSQGSNISNSVTYGPDRWFFIGGASSAIQWSQVTDTSIAGFNNSMRFQRASGNANTAAITMGQVLESADSYRYQGQSVVFSFWAATGANYSGGALTVQVVQGQGTNQSAANLNSAAWSSQSFVVNTTQALTSTMTRYQFTGTVAAATTQLGILLTWTPSGTAGANDYIQMNGFQLEAGQVAGPFEHRDIQVEVEICQRYFWQVNEPASGVVVGMGACNSTTAAIIYMATPVQMRTAPTVTVTAGTFKCAPAGATASGTAAAGTTHTPNAITINVSSITTTTAGFGTPLQGGGGAGVIAASADF